MANKEQGDFTKQVYTGDGQFGDLTINSREIDQYVWPIVRSLLGMH